MDILCLQDIYIFHIIKDDMSANVAYSTDFYKKIHKLFLEITQKFE